MQFAKAVYQRGKILKNDSPFLQGTVLSLSLFDGLMHGMVPIITESLLDPELNPSELNPSERRARARSEV